MALCGINLIVMCCLLMLVGVEYSLQTSCTRVNRNPEELHMNGYYCMVIKYSCHSMTLETFRIFLKDPDHCALRRSHCFTITITNSHINNLTAGLFRASLYQCFLKIKELTITNSDIQSLDEDAFVEIMSWEFDQTQKLNLSHNDLSYIQANSFRSVKQLQVLDLSFNRLNSLGNSSYDLFSLKEFYVNNNNISRIEENVFQKLVNLEILNVAFNKIESFENETFSNLQNLKVLYLRNNLIAYLKEGIFQHLNNVEKLHLENNKLKFIGDDTLFGLQSLKYLHLNKNEIQTIARKEFTYVINLTFLNIGRNNLSILETETFLGLQNLKRLYLAGSNLTSIQKGTFDVLTQLTDFDLSNNPLRVLETNVFLKLYNLINLNLQDNKVMVIAPNAFAGLSNLQSINLLGCKLKSLRNNTFSGLQSLVALNLSNCDIENIQGGAFNSMQKLNILDLRNNKLKALNKNTFMGLNNLQKVYLDIKITDLNEFSFFGLESIAELSIYGPSSTISNRTDYNTINMKTNTITKLPSNTFDGLKSLHTLNLENLNIRKVSNRSFINLVSKYIRFTNVSIQTIDSEAFLNSSITSIMSKCSYENETINDKKHYYVYDFCGLAIQYIRPKAFASLHYDSRGTTVMYLNDNNLTTLTNNAFSHVNYIRLLRLDNSNIKEIEYNSFNGLGFSELCTNPKHQYNALYLNNNKIKRLFNRTFSTLQNIIELKLDSNGMHEIEPGTFNGLIFRRSGCRNGGYYDQVNVNTLYLNNNNLTYLLNGTFLNITNLAILKLENSNIENIEPGAFAGLTMHPQHVDNIINIDNNKLVVIHKNIFTKINNVHSIKICNNKLKIIEPEAFSNLSSLRNLNLCYNNLENILANTFFGLQNLTKLDLTGNKIFILNENSFYGLSRLRNLLLTENNIRNITLGVFQKFPLLEDLQLGANYISEFKSGTFSNLVKLQYLNLSSNEFSILNEIMLFPLHNLTLLDLDNNNLSNINYSSLISHLPALKYVVVNNNNWTCTVLTQMLKTFRSSGIDYVFNSSQKYTQENVYGITCSEGRKTEDETVVNKSATKLFQIQALDKNLEKNLRVSADSVSTTKSSLYTLNYGFYTIFVIILLYLAILKTIQFRNDFKRHYRTNRSDYSTMQLTTSEVTLH